MSELDIPAGVPIGIVEVHEIGSTGFYSGLLQAAKKLHALEGKLSQTTFEVVREIVIPWHFIHEKWLQRDSRFSVKIISYHHHRVVLVKATHNMVQINFDSNLTIVTAQNEPSEPEWIGEAPYIVNEEQAKKDGAFDDYPANIGDCQSPPAAELFKDINYPTKIEMDVSLSLDFESFRRTNRERCEVWHPNGLESWSLSDWFVAMVGEAGEACNLVKKWNRHRDSLVGNYKPSDLDLKNLEREIGREIADVVIYADLCATRLGLRLEDLIKQKFNEVSDRTGLTEFKL